MMAFNGYMSRHYSSKSLNIASHRYNVKGVTYPAILPAKGDKVTGKVCAYI